MDKLEREIQLHEDFATGKEAKTLAGHPVWKSVISELEESYIGAIRRGSWFPRKVREENCRRLQVLDDIVATIESKLIKGEEALRRLEAHNGSKQRK